MTPPLKKVLDGFGMAAAPLTGRRAALKARRLMGVESPPSSRTADL